MKPAKQSLRVTSPSEVLDLAISAEMDAHRFYLKAADQARDPKARATFLALAGDEEGHRLQLEAEYRHLIKNSEFSYRAGANILHRHLDQDLDELGVIALGIQAEKDAMAFYQESGATAKDPHLKKILLGFVAFEDNHRKLLEAEYQARLGRPWDDLELDLWVRE
jgi:rubrerythrin